VRNVLGFSTRRANRVAMLVIADLALQLVLIVAGLILFFSWSKLADPVDLGTKPTWGGLVFAVGMVLSRPRAARPALTEAPSP